MTLKRTSSPEKLRFWGTAKWEDVCMCVCGGVVISKAGHPPATSPATLGGWIIILNKPVIAAPGTLVAPCAPTRGGSRVQLWTG